MTKVGTECPGYDMVVSGYQHMRNWYLSQMQYTANNSNDRVFGLEPSHNKENKPRHEKTLFLQYANNKGADQPAHPRSLVSAFVVRCLESIIHLVSKSEISSLYLASVAAQAGLSLLWSQTPKTGFLVMLLIYGTRGSFRQRVTSLTLLSGCACGFERI